jgi:hypothetical protein
MFALESLLMTNPCGRLEFRRMTLRIASGGCDFAGPWIRFRYEGKPVYGEHDVEVLEPVTDEFI